MKTEKLTIGVLADRAGVSVETIRFYERKALLKQPVKRTTGYRQYSPEDARQIRFIKRAQELGFTLKEVKELLTLQATSKAMCGDVKVRSDQKIIEVEEKLQDLKRMLGALKRISNCCAKGEATHNSCPILDCLEGRC